MASQGTRSDGSAGVGVGVGQSAAEPTRRNSRIRRSGKARDEGSTARTTGAYLALVAITNAATVFVDRGPSGRFHLILAIACVLSVGSYALEFWRRSPAGPADQLRTPHALFLFVWATGLYGYVLASAASGTLNRVAAGVVGSVYVFFFLAELFIRLQSSGSGGTGSGTGTGSGRG